MRYNDRGEIIFNTATNGEDSPMAGSLAMIFTDMKVDVRHYFNNYLYQRCNNSMYSVSRDQAIAIATVVGLAFKDDDDRAALVDTSRVNGNDILVPIWGHFRACKGLKPFAWQDKILKHNIEHHAKKTPHDELNQLLLQMWMHPEGDNLIKLYCKLNPEWRKAIYFWLKDRNEYELAEIITHKIKDRINGLHTI